MFLVVVYVLLLVWLWWPRTTGPKIPKIIWSFWDGEQPPIVKACIDSWRRMAPDYEIRILDKESTKDLQKYKDTDTNPTRH
jgi:mannosyltransferase OCH1-like enzyme